MSPARLDFLLGWQCPFNGIYMGVGKGRGCANCTLPNCEVAYENQRPLDGLLASAEEKK